jgi:hypothetical protein
VANESEATADEDGCYSMSIIVKLLGASSLLIALNLLMIWGEYAAIAPNGTDELQLIARTLSGLLLLPSLIGIPVLMAAAWRRKYRRRALTLLPLCLLYPILFFGSVDRGERIRMKAFTELADRSRPLIEAIENYERHHGSPPRQLQDLVPQFLPAIPTTGLGAYPKYEYELIRDGETWHRNPWLLWVDCTQGFSFDKFYYFPNQAYPTQGYGGSWERIGDWAYFDE